MKKLLLVLAISAAFFGLAMWLEDKWDMTEKVS